MFTVIFGEQDSPLSPMFRDGTVLERAHGALRI